MKLAIKDIHVDPSVQLRDGLDLDRVKAMQEFEEGGGHLPPVTVVGDDNLLADGFHRVEAADSSGRIDIEADHVDGDHADAVALAIQLNDIAVAKPLTPDQRSKGVRLLLAAGWTPRRIAERTGVAPSTIKNAATVMGLKGEFHNIAKPTGRPPKARKALPTDVVERLGDTMLVRIAEMVEPDDQLEFAAAVAAVPRPGKANKSGMSEAQVRTAARKLREGDYTPTEAVQLAASSKALPKNLQEVARLAYRRIDQFLDETMIIDGREYDFWAVMELLVAERGRLLDPTINSLVASLSNLSVRSDHYATALRSEDVKKVSA